jgi:hypothetical protein
MSPEEEGLSPPGPIPGQRLAARPVGVEDEPIASRLVTTPPVD